MRVTIHQPDMMPWIGLFNKIYNSETWVVLDHTLNNPRDAAFWGRRVQILVNKSASWLSLPLAKPRQTGVLGIPVKDLEFNDSDPKVYIKALKTVELNYKKSQFFDEIFPIVESHLLSNEMNMSKRNMAFIIEVMKILNINTKVIYSSSMNCVERSTKLLVEILKKLNAKKYICGGGAVGYQEDELFRVNQIELKYNNYSPTPYHQNGIDNFIPGLSIIDALFQVGINETERLVKQEV